MSRSRRGNGNGRGSGNLKQMICYQCKKQYTGVKDFGKKNRCYECIYIRTQTFKKVMKKNDDFVRY